MTSTWRYAVTSVITALGVLVGTAATGGAATAPAGAAVTFGATTEAAAAAGTGHSCAAGGSTCAGSDRAVTLAWTGADETTGCRFRLSVDWGDGKPAQVVNLKGAAAGTVWPVAHTYAGRVSARHPYRIKATATVAADARGRGCSIESGALTFALLCTGKQLSGPAWNDRFPGGNRDVAALNAKFRGKVEPFIAAMTEAGVSVQPQSTLRSPQRSYLMHFSYLVAKGQLSPQDVPAYVPVTTEKTPGVCWLHRNPSGSQARATSVAAAASLLRSLGVDPSLRTPPALRSRHNTGDAIDMRVQWTARTITVTDAAGRDVKISSAPRDGTNPELIAVGATYGVKHFAPAAVDRNHWSSDGH